jgi:hypothetical protein
MLAVVAIGLPQRFSLHTRQRLDPRAEHAEPDSAAMITASAIFGRARACAKG